MDKTHEFYPMVSGTIKAILNIVSNNPKQEHAVLRILATYPKQTTPPPTMCPVEISFTILDELDRQYARWNKGGKK